MEGVAAADGCVWALPWRTRARFCSCALTAAARARMQAGLKKKQMYNCGLFNDWLVRAGHEPFAQWTQSAESGGKVVPMLEPLLDEAGVAVRVSPACIIEYLMKMAHGDAQVAAQSRLVEARQVERNRRE